MTGTNYLRHQFSYPSWLRIQIKIQVQNLLFANESHRLQRKAVAINQALYAGSQTLQKRSLTDSKFIETFYCYGKFIDHNRTKISEDMTKQLQSLVLECLPSSTKTLTQFVPGRKSQRHYDIMQLLKKGAF